MSRNFVELNNSCKVCDIGCLKVFITILGIFILYKNAKKPIPYRYGLLSGDKSLYLNIHIIEQLHSSSSSTKICLVLGIPVGKTNPDIAKIVP